MTVQGQHLLASLAAVYCFALAIISLLQKSKSKSHLLFAAYNIANGTWNCGDLILLFDKPSSWEWLHQITSFGGVWIIPFVVHFSYQLIGLNKEAFFKKIILTFYALGIFFSCLTLTRFLNVGALSNAPAELAGWQDPGPLYPVYIVYMLLGTLSIQIPYLMRLRKASGLLRKRILYLLIATSVGMLAMGLFFISFIAVNLPWIYFSLQILVGFIFAYAIFQQDLLGVNVVFRRMALIVGLYSFLGTVLTAIMLWFQQSIPVGNIMPIGIVVIMIVLILAIASAGPWIYIQIINRFTLFQERSAIELTHEFKTPLTAIQSAQEILDRELAQPKPDAAKVQHYMNMIQRNTQRLEKFVLDILNVGKAAETSKEIEGQHVKLDVLMRDVLAHFPDSKNRIELSVNGDCAIEANAEALRQVFTNLISNAVDASPTATVYIAIHRKNDEVVLSIRDGGYGIAKEDLKRIFLPFNRSKHSGNKGTGLGLAIAERWVRAHNGRIWAESDGLNHGATFFVVLPTT